MARKFKIETVLSAISGINITSDFKEVFELYWYVFDDNTINDSGLVMLRQTLFEHLGNQYEELYKARYYVYTQCSMLQQKYGKELVILPIMPEKEITYTDCDIPKKHSKN